MTTKWLQERGNGSKNGVGICYQERRMPTAIDTEKARMNENTTGVCPGSLCLRAES